MAQWLKEVSVGEWYRAAGEPFEIVGVDAKAEVVLVQFFDGTLEEYDFDSWGELNAVPCPPPEDYSGALDMDPQDYGADDDQAGSNRWDNPLDALDTRY
jgi:hypothetical protein